MGLDCGILPEARLNTDRVSNYGGFHDKDETVIYL